MKRSSAVVWITLTLAGASSCERERAPFSWTRRSGDWGLFKSQPDGPELIACFGGMYESQDDERMCMAALASGNLGAGDFFCSVFP
jgi:hypothetical protein